MNDDPTNNENDETKEAIDGRRRDVLAKKTQELLMADESTISEFDKDGNGNPIYELQLIVDSPEESMLSRLGYGQIQFSHVASSIDARGVVYPDITTVIVLGQDKESEVKMFSLKTGEDGHAMITTESEGSELIGVNPETGGITRDIEDQDASIGFRPTTRPVTAQEELQLQSIVDGCRDYVTLPS